MEIKLHGRINVWKDKCMEEMDERTKCMKDKMYVNKIGGRG